MTVADCSLWGTT